MRFDWLLLASHGDAIVYAVFSAVLAAFCYALTRNRLLRPLTRWWGGVGSALWSSLAIWIVCMVRSEIQPFVELSRWFQKPVDLVAQSDTGLVALTALAIWGITGIALGLAASYRYLAAKREDGDN